MFDLRYFFDALFELYDDLAQEIVRIGPKMNRWLQLLRKHGNRWERRFAWRTLRCMRSTRKLVASVR